MSRNRSLATVVLMIVFPGIIGCLGCAPKKTGNIHFSGIVLSNARKPIEAAEVEVSGLTARTDGRGFFKLTAARAKGDRYVLNIRKPGFGLVSRIYDRGIRDGKWTLTQGTTQVLDPSQPIKVRDMASSVRSNCQGRPNGRIDWSRYPQQRIPRIADASGRAIPGELPLELKEALRLLDAGTECSPGISVSIPPNSLVTASGRVPSGRVEVTVSTVDLYAPDSMPGDFSVETEGEAAYMQSYGAGTVSITAGGKPIELKKGARAEVAIPIDPTQLKIKAPIPPAIPFLRYDEKKGLWKLIGTARLNSKGDAYIADVDHLSAFNADLVKTNQSCVRIDSTAIAGTYSLEVTIPMGGGTAPTVRTFTIGPDPNHPENPNIHAIYNLPANTWIMLVPIRDASSDNPVPLGTFVVNTGNPQNPSTPNKPEWDYGACQGKVTLFEVQLISYAVDGGGRHFGPLPAIIYALADQATGQDIYPLGPNAFFLFGLFDTGSTKVRIYNELPYYYQVYGDPNSGLICRSPNRLTDGNFFNSDANILGLTGPTIVRLRLNGLSVIDPVTLTAPIGPPGTGGAPQVELAGVEVRPEPSSPDPTKKLDVTLIGIPAIHQAAVKIDYTKYVERSGFRNKFYPGMNPGNSGLAGFQEFDKVFGPDIIFYAPNDPLIPFPNLFLELGRWGTPQRYCLKKVTFLKGSLRVKDADLPNNMIVQYDTGTTITIINDYVAAQLGLVAGSGTFDVWAPGDHKGYVLDQVTMDGPDGTYAVNNACVVWDQSRIQAAAVVAAVLGSNFFDQVPVLFDGTRNRLGIGPPTATPVTWPALPNNCRH
jgi:hypothetical protein